MAPAELKLTRARTQLLLNQPFFGTLALRVSLEAREGIPTMQTDGRRIQYSPRFVDSLSVEILQSALAHEILHLALAHHCRRGDRDPKRWNIAADHAINPLILEAGMKLGDGWLIDKQYAGMSAEQIYARLPQDAGGNGGGSRGMGAGSRNGSGDPQAQGGGNQAQPGDAPATPGGCGQICDATDDDGNKAGPAEQSRQETEWTIAAEQSARAAKTAGKLPGSLDRLVQQMKQPSVDWRAVLRRFIAESVPTDYTWQKPNRRYIAGGLYLPSTFREGIGTLVVAVDVSGSVGDEQLAQFAGELNAISQEARPEAVHVVYCDTRIQRTDEYTADDEIKLRATGGGGTDFRPPFVWVEKQGITPKCLLYLTDLCCSDYPTTEPDYPVMWVTDSPDSAGPWGETLRLPV
jgi:predicted metal-dependent peptidase